MTRSFEDVMASLPIEEQAAINQRADEIVTEIEGLRALRRLAQQSQEQLASTLKITQPSIHKMEQQTDLYLSTLRRFVEAAGGTLELRVTLPGKGVIRLNGVGSLQS